MNEKKIHILSLLAALTSAVIFGMSFMFSKLALEVAQPTVLLAFRFAVAVAAMTLVIAVILAVVSREKHCAVAARPGVSEGRAVGVDGDRRQNMRRLEIKHRVYDGMFRSGFPGLAPAVPPPAVSRFIRRPFRPVPCPESFSPGKRHSCNCVPVWCRPDRSERRTASLRWHTFP